MEEKKDNFYNNYNKIDSPILNYYSHIINNQNPLNNSKIYKINQTYFPSKKLSSIKFKIDNQNNKINKSVKEQIHEDKSKNIIFGITDNHKLEINSKIKIINNKKEKKENDLSKINIKNNKNEKKENDLSKIKEIKTIKSEDLIPTLINGKTILRINPFIYMNESYEFLSNNIYILLKDQCGCKFLQEKLDKDTINAICYFYPAILPNLLVLIKDSFANYFIQKICYYLDEDQIENILKIISPELFEICCNKYGSRTIQGIMNYMQTEKLRIFFFELIKPIFISLIYELNGIYIIYKFINEFPEFLNQINNIIVDNCINIAKHKGGNSFLENYLIMINYINSFEQNIIDILINNCLNLIIDPKANYIIQFILTLGDNYIIESITNKILNDIALYSKNKYSNYVVEKLILISNNENRNKIINKLAKPEIMKDLICDQHGNYIILNAVKFSNKEKQEVMLNIINNLEPEIKKSLYGKIFLNKIYNNNFY